MKFLWPHIPRWYFSMIVGIGLLLMADWIFMQWGYQGAQLDIPIGVHLSLGAFVVYVSFLMGYLYVRAKSPIILTESSIRQSTNDLHPLASVDFGGEGLPPMQLWLARGGAAYGMSIPDRDAILAPKDACEKVSDRVLVVHAPVEPLDGEVLGGIAGYEASLAEHAPHSAFTPKGKSMLLLSFLNTLTGNDSARLRHEQTFTISKFERLMRERRKGNAAGPERFAQELRGIAAAMRRETPKEKLGRFFGSRQADEQARQEQDAERVQ